MPPTGQVGRYLKANAHRGGGAHPHHGKGALVDHRGGGFPRNQDANKEGGRLPLNQVDERVRCRRRRRRGPAAAAVRGRQDGVQFLTIGADGRIQLGGMDSGWADTLSSPKHDASALEMHKAAEDAAAPGSAPSPPSRTASLQKRTIAGTAAAAAARKGVMVDRLPMMIISSVQGEALAWRQECAQGAARPDRFTGAGAIDVC